MKAGTIRVNSERVERSYIVKLGDIVSLHATQMKETTKVGSQESDKKALDSYARHVATMQRAGFKVLHEDTQMAVAFKPPGILG